MKDAEIKNRVWRSKFMKNRDHSWRTWNSFVENMKLIHEGYKIRLWGA